MVEWGKVEGWVVGWEKHEGNENVLRFERQ